MTIGTQTERLSVALQYGGDCKGSKHLYLQLANLRPRQIKTVTKLRVFLSPLPAQSQGKIKFILDTFLPHTSFFVLLKLEQQLPTKGPSGLQTSVSFADEGEDKKTEIPPLKNFANVFHFKLILSLERTFKTVLEPGGKKCTALNSRNKKQCPAGCQRPDFRRVG